MTVEELQEMLKDWPTHNDQGGPNYVFIQTTHSRHRTRACVRGEGDAHNGSVWDLIVYPCYTDGQEDEDNK